MAQTYSEVLKSPLWQRKRLEILSRDSFTCQLCQDTETELHVHHKKYTKGHKPWEYPNDNFTTFCIHCHTLIEYTKGEPMDPILVVKRHIEDSADKNLIMLFQDEYERRLSIYWFKAQTREIQFRVGVSKEGLDIMYKMLNNG